MKILLQDFNAKMGREDIFKPTIGNESLHKIMNINENRNRAVNFATSTNQIVKNKMFLPHNIHKFTLTHNQIGCILIPRRQHTSILDV
jgi:regulatory protein YycH of two-component signal transduction system YycFG